MDFAKEASEKEKLVVVNSSDLLGKYPQFPELFGTFLERHSIKTHSLSEEQRQALEDGDVKSFQDLLSADANPAGDDSAASVPTVDDPAEASPAASVSTNTGDTSADTGDDSAALVSEGSAGEKPTVEGVPASAASADAPVPSPNRYKCVRAVWGGVTVRKSAEMDGPSVGKLEKEDIITSVEQKEGDGTTWIHIDKVERMADGKSTTIPIEGWVSLTNSAGDAVFKPVDVNGNVIETGGGRGGGPKELAKAITELNLPDISLKAGETDKAKTYLDKIVEKSKELPLPEEVVDGAKGLNDDLKEKDKELRSKISELMEIYKTIELKLSDLTGPEAEQFRGLVEKVKADLEKFDFEGAVKTAEGLVGLEEPGVVAEKLFSLGEPDGVSTELSEKIKELTAGLKDTSELGEELKGFVSKAKELSDGLSEGKLEGLFETAWAAAKKHVPGLYDSGVVYLRDGMQEKLIDGYRDNPHVVDFLTDTKKTLDDLGLLTPESLAFAKAGLGLAQKVLEDNPGWKEKVNKITKQVQAALESDAASAAALNPKIGAPMAAVKLAADFVAGQTAPSKGDKPRDGGGSASKKNKKKTRRKNKRKTQKRKTKKKTLRKKRKIKQYSLSLSSDSPFNKIKRYQSKKKRSKKKNKRKKTKKK